MYSVADHVKNCPMDQEMLNIFLELYKLSGEVDPNRLVSGVDIFRNYEYGYPLMWLKDIINPTSMIWDIGSSSTIWPTLLFKKFGCDIFATDIDMEHLETQKHYLHNIGALDQLGQKFRFEYQDATRTTYQPESFDVVCSVSAIEHIPGDGDVQAVIEAERVLKPGGTFILTAPYAPLFSESTTDHYHHGYEKRYSFDSIVTRFAEATRLHRKKLLFINGKHEQSDLISDFWYQHHLYQNLGQISMFFSLLMFDITTEPKENTKGFIALYEKSAH